MKTFSSKMTYGCLTFLLSSLLLGCVDSPPSETTNSADIPESKVIIPENGGEPVLAEEGP
jgi:hypothetical protein